MASRREAELVREIQETEAQIEGLKEVLDYDPARRLIYILPRSGDHKGEVYRLTTKQFRDLLGYYPPKAVVVDNHVPWEYAFDQLATEMGYESDEALRKAVERARKDNDELKALKDHLGYLEDELEAEHTSAVTCVVTKDFSMPCSAFPDTECRAELTNCDGVELMIVRQPSHWEGYQDGKRVFYTRYAKDARAIVRKAASDLEDSRTEATAVGQRQDLEDADTESTDWTHWYTDKQAIQHLLLLEDHLLDYGERSRDDHCVSCMVWHCEKLKAYSILEAAKFFEGQHARTYERVNALAEQIQAKLVASEGMPQDEAVSYSRQVRDLRYELIEHGVYEFKQEKDAAALQSVPDVYRAGAESVGCGMKYEVGGAICCNEHECIIPKLYSQGDPMAVDIPLACPSGYDVVGSYHTHPGGPAYPSAVDVKALQKTSIASPVACISNEDTTRCYRIKRNKYLTAQKG